MFNYINQIFPLACVKPDKLHLCVCADLSWRGPTRRHWRREYRRRPRPRQPLFAGTRPRRQRFARCALTYRCSGAASSSSSSNGAHCLPFGLVSWHGWRLREAQLIKMSCSLQAARLLILAICSYWRGWCDAFKDVCDGLVQPGDSLADLCSSCFGCT